MKNKKNWTNYKNHIEKYMFAWFWHTPIVCDSNFQLACRFSPRRVSSIHWTLCHPCARTSASQAVLSWMQLTLHATRRTPHGASRLVLAMYAWLVTTGRAPSGHCRDAWVYGHTTTAMHDNEYTPHHVWDSSFEVACRSFLFFLFETPGKTHGLFPGGAFPMSVSDGTSCVGEGRKSLGTKY